MPVQGVGLAAAYVVPRESARKSSVSVERLSAASKRPSTHGKGSPAASMPPPAMMIASYLGGEAPAASIQREANIREHRPTESASKEERGARKQKANKKIAA